MNFARTTRLIGSLNGRPALGDEILHFVEYGGLEIVGAIAGLGHRGRVDVDLNFGLALGDNIGLEVWRNLDDEQQLAFVHFRVDLGRLDVHGGLECRPNQPFGDLSREIRTVLVHDTDGKIGRFGDGSGRHRVDRNAEGVGHEDQHRRIGADTSQLFDHQAKDIENMIAQRHRFRLRQFCTGSAPDEDISRLLLAKEHERQDEVGYRDTAIAAMLAKAPPFPAPLRRRRR